jgi:hypothetical protein
MVDQELVEALAECLEALRQGEERLEACLARHAEQRAELEALLEVARLIPGLPAEVEPSAPFKERTRHRLLGGANGGPAAFDIDWSASDLPF